MAFSTLLNKYLLLHFKVMALLACINDVLQTFISLWKSDSLWNKTVIVDQLSHNPIFDFAFEQKLIDWQSPLVIRLIFTLGRVSVPYC